MSHIEEAVACAMSPTADAALKQQVGSLFCSLLYFYKSFLICPCQTPLDQWRSTHTYTYNHTGIPTNRRDLDVNVFAWSTARTGNNMQKDLCPTDQITLSWTPMAEQQHRSSIALHTTILTRQQSIRHFCTHTHTHTQRVTCQQ